MTWWLIDGGGVLAVLAVAANYRWYPVRAWWYDWARAKHLVKNAESWRIGDRWPDGQVGSMILAEEREFLTTTPNTRMTIWAPSGEVEFSEEPDWREQFAALSPEALDDFEAEIDRGIAEKMSWLPDLRTDSGPGKVVPPVPGPDLGPRAAWVLDDYERRHREKWAWVEPARFAFAEAAT